MQLIKVDKIKVDYEKHLKRALLVRNLYFYLQQFTDPQTRGRE